MSRGEGQASFGKKESQRERRGEDCVSRALPFARVSFFPPPPSSLTRSRSIKQLPKPRRKERAKNGKRKSRRIVRRYLDSLELDFSVCVR